MRWTLLKQPAVLPGFGLTLGFTVVYLCLIILIPLSSLAVQASGLDARHFLEAAFSDRALAAYGLSLRTSLLAALFNGAAGLMVAWVLVRYPFPGSRFVDGLIDLPFALPTAVAGIVLTALYAPGGWIGSHFESLGIKVAYSELGIFVALTFIGLPFVVRTVQPVLQNLDPEVEEASNSLGAGYGQTLRRVIFPEIRPALLTGMVLAFARGLGEYGSVIFIAGNLPLKTEITPLLIMIKLEEYDYAGASAIALVFLVISFCLILIVNLLEREKKNPPVLEQT
jgi:sulfate transport system permease protein